MSTKWVIISIAAVMAAAATVSAEPFAVQATHDLHVGNDPQLGPTQREDGSGLHVRNIATRRRVAFVRYDISQLKQPGKVFHDVFLSVRVTTDYQGPISVWGVKEQYEDINFSTINWLTAPGVLNDPLPPLDSPVELDYADLSPLLMTFQPLRNDRMSTATSVALADFLNDDTDGVIVLMLAETGSQTANAIMRPINYATAGTGYMSPGGTELFGVVLAGQVVEPIWASYPQPANNQTVSASLSQLCWVNPEPNEPSGAITSNIYFGTNEPNAAAPGYGLPLIASNSAENCQVIPYSIEPFTTYYWAVETIDPTRSSVPTRGPLWSFNTNNNAPIVDAGINQYIWLNNAGDPASATVYLNATAADDGMPVGELYFLWTQVSGPAGVIDPNGVVLATDETADQKNVTLVLPQTGSYIFRFSADDTDLTGSAMVQVVVAADPCLAAQAMPGYTAPPGDFNNDCVVDMNDFAELARHWLECNSLAPCE